MSDKVPTYKYLKTDIENVDKNLHNKTQYIFFSYELIDEITFNSIDSAGNWSALPPTTCLMSALAGCSAADKWQDQAEEWVSNCDISTLVMLFYIRLCCCHGTSLNCMTIYCNLQHSLIQTKPDYM